MAVEMTADSDILECDTDLPANDALLQHAFVDEHGVPHGAPQSFDHCLRGGKHVVEQSHLAQIAMLGQVDAEEVVRQGVGDEIEEADLVASGETDARVVDLLNGQIRLLQQRRQRDPGRFRPSAGQPCNHSVGMRNGAERACDDIARSHAGLLETSMHSRRLGVAGRTNT